MGLQPRKLVPKSRLQRLIHSWGDRKGPTTSPLAGPLILLCIVGPFLTPNHLHSHRTVFNSNPWVPATVASRSIPLPPGLGSEGVPSGRGRCG